MNTPERWANSFLNNVNQGNIIPIKHRESNTNSLHNLKSLIYNPANYPTGNQIHRSGTLPNLKKTLKTLSSNTPEFIPKQPPPPTSPYPFENSYKSPARSERRSNPIPITSEQDFLILLLAGKRVYINHYDTAQWPDFISYYVKNKELYHIRFHSYDMVDDVKVPTKNPYYWISRYPPKNRAPLRSIGQGTRRRKLRKQRHTRRR